MVASCGSPLPGRVLMGFLLLFLLAVYGLANAVAILKVGKPLRLIASRIGPFYLHQTSPNLAEARRSIWQDLVECPACLSFWIGIAASLYAFSPASSVVHDRAVAATFDGLAASGSSWIIHVVLEKIMPSHL